MTLWDTVATGCTMWDTVATWCQQLPARQQLRDRLLSRHDLPVGVEVSKAHYLFLLLERHVLAEGVKGVRPAVHVGEGVGKPEVQNCMPVQHEIPLPCPLGNVHVVGIRFMDIQLELPVFLELQELLVVHAAQNPSNAPLDECKACDPLGLSALPKLIAVIH
jgi:hypothetical protein